MGSECELKSLGAQNTPQKARWVGGFLLLPSEPQHLDRHLPSSQTNTLTSWKNPGQDLLCVKIFCN